ncbi:MAG TPA: hypothetical protein PKU80_04100 [Candidatus Limiplasma sp.]|nr:hypothetical protein [Candidatus Limiplasma sp.]HRX08689.1 hypothetical protein [Candidatus Limiplasma sp.]
MRAAIGLDTSCYTTSAAIADENGEIIGFQRKLLPVQPGTCGLRQSEAVFAHLKQLPELVEELMAEAKEADISAVIASATPRDAEDSYMPVFTVGRSFGRAMASTLKVPYYETSHQMGHILAGMIGNPPIAGPFVAMHISGGTTETLLCEGDTVRLIGQTLDLHAGQLVDRIGVQLGFGFPAGAALEQLAMQAVPEARLPVSLARGDLDCHLSGAETQAKRWLEAGEYARETVAAELFDFLARTAARMLAAACRETGAQTVLLVGGVASSVLLRDMIPARLNKLGCYANVLFGKREYASDNAAGVARLGMRRQLETEGLPCRF